MPSLPDLAPADLDALEASVQGVIDQKRIGRPVFVRYTLLGSLRPEELPALLSRMLDAARRWLNQPLARVHAVGSPDSGQVSVAARTQGGATALLSAGCTRGPGDVIDVMILGDHGAIFHDASGRCAPQSEIRSPKSETASEFPRSGEDYPRYGILLVAGCHTHQELYAPAFAADPRCHLVALTDELTIDDRTRCLNEALARKFGVPCVADLDEALRNPKIDVVSVCAPPERRGRIALRCAAAGKHLYLDKPLVPRLSEADALVAAVKKFGIRSQMFSFIHQPWAAHGKRLLAKQRLGELRAVHADAFFAKGQAGTAQPGKPRREEYPPERQQQIRSKREWDNVGVYPVTLIHFLTGKKFQTVHGITANYFFREHQRDDVEDFGLLCGTLEGGIPVTITAGRCGWTSHPAAGPNRVILVGSEQTVILDANRPRLEVFTDEPPWTPPRPHPEDPMAFWASTQEEVGSKPKRTWVPAGEPARSDVSFFLDCLDAGKDSPMSVIEAAHATEVLLATYLSASSGEVVSLPLPR